MNRSERTKGCHRGSCLILKSGNWLLEAGSSPFDKPPDLVRDLNPGQAKVPFAASLRRRWKESADGWSPRSPVETLWWHGGPAAPCQRRKAWLWPGLETARSGLLSDQSRTASLGP